MAIATAGYQCADSGSFTALTQPWCSQFSSLLRALHMGFVPAFGLDSSLRHFLLSAFLCFFTIPSRQQGQLARTWESWTVHMAQMMPQGKRHPPSPAWWPHSLTHWFLSICQHHSSWTPHRASTTMSWGWILLVGSPSWNLRFYQCKRPRYKFAESVCPRREHSASFSFHNTLKGWVQHWRQTGIWKRSNKDRETSLAPQKHVPEAASFLFIK